MATVRYLVKNVDAAVAFYTQHLGFALELQMGPAFAIVAHDDLSLWLAGPKSSAARAMPDGRQPESGGWNRLVLEVDDLEAEVVALREAGVNFRNEIVIGPGGQQVLVDDADGNPVELFQPT